MTEIIPDKKAQMIEALRNPAKMRILLEQVIFKVKFELDLTLIGLPKSKEQPKHAYVILFSDGTDSERLRDAIANLSASFPQQLPITISSGKAARINPKTKLRQIYNTLCFDFKEEPKNVQPPTN